MRNDASFGARSIDIALDEIIVFERAILVVSSYCRLQNILDSGSYSCTLIHLKCLRLSVFEPKVAHFRVKKMRFRECADAW